LECGELMLGIRDYAAREKHTCCGGAALNDVHQVRKKRKAS
jgi:hypothetical protein